MRHKPSKDFVRAVIADLEELSSWCGEAANTEKRVYRGKQDLADDTVTLNRAIWLLEESLKEET